MNFGGHQSFALRDHWLYKGLTTLEERGDLFDSVEEAVTELGVGTNMVHSIKHWLQAIQAVTKTSTDFDLNEFGKTLLERDRYFDNVGTSWLVHYKIVTNLDRATTWFWFFNKFGITEFTEDSLLHYLEAYVDSLGKNVKESTLSKDITALLKMYAPPEYKVKQTPEDNQVCPLTDLRLIERLPSGGFRVTHPHSSSIPVDIFGYILVDFWKNYLERMPEFTFEALMTSDCSPGKTLCLTQDSMIELLDSLVEYYPKQFSYSRSGGFFKVSIHKGSITPLLNNYYGALNGQA